MSVIRIADLSIRIMNLCSSIMVNNCFKLMIWIKLWLDYSFLSMQI